MMWWLLSTSLAGQTVHVPGDYATVQAALTQVDPDDVIQLGPGTFELSGAVLTVPLVGHGEDTIVRRSSNDVVFAVDGTVLDLSHMVIEGQGHAAVDCVDGEVRLKSVVLRDGGDTSHDDGGLVRLEQCTATFTDVEMAAATVVGRGGLLYAVDSDISVFGSSFQGGGALQGGAAWVSGGSLSLAASTAAVSSATDGGGFYLDATTATFDQVVLDRLSATGTSGAIHAVGSDLHLASMEVLDSDAVAGAGAVHLVSGTVQVLGGRFAGNVGGDAGALLCGAAATACTAVDAVFDGNEGDRGAAVHVDADAVLHRLTFCDNGPASVGGGLWVGSGASVQGEANVYVRNQAGGGGAIYVSDGAHDARHATMVGNDATTGAAMQVAAGSGSLVNGLVADHTGGVALDDSGLGTFLTTTNLFWNNALADASFPLDPYDIVGSDPLVVDLGAVGCDRGAYAPTKGSPLIDAGSGPDEDDGTPPDIGATGGPLGDDSDLDGDGVDDSVDCDDGDASVGRPQVVYTDGDGDGYGDPYTATIGCPGIDGVSVPRDCDDTAAAVNPGAEEIDDNGIDDDCDGVIDEELLLPWYEDVDGDGYGDVAAEVLAETQPKGFVADATDCDDQRYDVNPAATEVCDGSTDEDCDGLVDDDDDSVAGTTEWWVDSDGDGYGDDAALTVFACVAPADHVIGGGDCDDGDAAVNVDAVEVCDGSTDEDCDGLVDDDDPDVTGASTVFLDSDGDGYGDPAVAITTCDPGADTVTDDTDCDDTRAAVNPGAAEVCDGLGLDEDCDDLVDAADPDVPEVTWYVDGDDDGYAGTAMVGCALPDDAALQDSDCDDARADVNPGVPEVCDPDDVDEDCNGLADDADPGVTGQVEADLDLDGDGYSDGATVRQCDPVELPVGDCDDGDTTRYPGAVDAPDDGIDQDCDGIDAIVVYGGGGCSCSTAGGVAGWPLVAVLLGLGRRRSRT